MDRTCVSTRLPRAAPVPPASRPAGDLSRPAAKSYDASVRGALITVRCDCGGIGYVPYDERWECPSCHRRWNTGQIPAEEYWGIMRDMRRMRINVIATALGAVIAVVVLSTVVGLRVLLLLPIVMSF